jgi:hypothetical protein
VVDEPALRKTWMTKRTTTAVLVVSALLLALLWAPWLTRESAERRIVDQFTAAWRGVIDGCGFSCEGCGVKKLARVLTGYSVSIEYACGLLPHDSPAFHEKRTVHVSLLGTVHGLPRP